MRLLCHAQAHLYIAQVDLHFSPLIHPQRLACVFNASGHQGLAHRLQSARRIAPLQPVARHVPMHLPHPAVGRCGVAALRFGCRPCRFARQCHRTLVVDRRQLPPTGLLQAARQGQQTLPALRRTAGRLLVGREHLVGLAQLPVQIPMLQPGAEILGVDLEQL